MSTVLLINPCQFVTLFSQDRTARACVYQWLGTGKWRIGLRILEQDGLDPDRDRWVPKAVGRHEFATRDEAVAYAEQVVR